MWYFGDGGIPRGPVDMAEIRRLISTGQVNPATLVWRQGFPGWLPASQTEPATLSQPMLPTPAIPPQFAAPPTFYEPASAHPATGVHFAGFWIRVLAAIIDAAILQVSAAILALMIVLPFAASAMRGGSISIWGLFIGGSGGLIGLLWGLAYYTAIPAGRWQATPGKRIVGIYVVRPSGVPIGLLGFLGRYFAYLLDFLTIYIGFMMAGWTQQKQALHDIMCDTRVIYGRR